MLLTLLSLACVVDALREGACLPEEERVQVAACVVPAGAAPSAEVMDAVAALDLAEATVLAQGLGTPPEGCLSLLAWIAGNPVERGSSTTAWVTVEDPARGAFTVSFTASAADLVLEGPVDLAWRQEDASAFAGLYGRHRLELRDHATGALLAWMEDAGSLASLELPAELQVAAADEECRVEQECGTEVWTRATFTADGVSATLRPGGADDLGGLRVSFAGAMALEDLSCSETSGGGVLAAALAL